MDGYLESLVFALGLNEDLIVKVVAIGSDKRRDVAHDLEHVETLLQRLSGQVGVRQLEAVFLSIKDI